MSVLLAIVGAFAAPSEHWWRAPEPPAPLRDVASYAGSVVGLTRGGALVRMDGPTWTELAPATSATEGARGLVVHEGRVWVLGAMPPVGVPWGPGGWGPKEPVPVRGITGAASVPGGLVVSGLDGTRAIRDAAGWRPLPARVGHRRSPRTSGAGPARRGPGEGARTEEVDGWPTGVGFVEGRAVPQERPSAPTDGITAIVADGAGDVWVGLDAEGGPLLVALAGDLSERGRWPMPSEVRGLAADGGGVWVASRGVHRADADGPVPVALDGEEVRAIAVQDGRIAAWTPTRGLVWTDATGRVAGERAPPSDAEGTGVAWDGERPVAVTRQRGRLLGPELDRALPMPAAAVTAAGGGLWIAMPDAGIAHLDHAGALSSTRTWPGALDVVADGDGWLAAVGTHGLRDDRGSVCDLPGHTGLLAPLGDGRFVVASDALVLVVERVP